MADRRPYRVRSVWNVPARPDAVRQVLADVADYPRWWPSIVDAGAVDDGVGWIRVRGWLPWTIRTRLTRAVESDRILAATIDGDLAG